MPRGWAICPEPIEKILAPYNKPPFNGKPQDKEKIIRFVTMQGTPLGTNILADVGGRGLEDYRLDELVLQRRDNWKTEARFAGHTLHEHKKGFAKANVSSINASEEMRKHCKNWLDGLVLVVNECLFGDAKVAFKPADIAISRAILGDRTAVLIGTLSSMDRDDAAYFPADVVIIDECGQASMGEIAIPLAKFRAKAARFVVAGDHLQFASVVTSIKMCTGHIHVGCTWSEQAPEIHEFPELTSR